MAPQWQPVPVAGGVLAVEILGPEAAGPPVIVVQTALEAEELRPLSRHLSDAGCRVAYVRRAGYGGPGALPVRGSVADDAGDLQAVARALGWGPVHAVGASYSSAVALAWAAVHPVSVLSLSLLEAPPTSTSSGPLLREASQKLLATYMSEGPAAALDAFMARFMGTDWRAVREHAIPGSVALLERDAPSFFEGDLSAVLEWRFGPADAAAVRCPVLYLEGTESGPMFAPVGPWLASLLPQTRRVRVPGAGHDLDLTHASTAAAHIVAFLGPSARG